MREGRNEVQSSKSLGLTLTKALQIDPQHDSFYSAYHQRVHQTLGVLDFDERPLDVITCQHVLLFSSTSLLEPRDKYMQYSRGRTRCHTEIPVIAHVLLRISLISAS